MRVLVSIACVIVTSSLALAACVEDDPSVLGGTRRTTSSNASSDPSGDGGGRPDDPASVDAGADRRAPSDGGSSGSSGSDAGPKDGGTTPQELCVSIINEYRATLGAPPLTRWNGAETCADNQAKSDKAASKPHGAFPGCGEFGQNECLGLSAPMNIRPCLAAMWAEGPGGGHYENMRSLRWTQVACGFGPNPGDWAVQDFR